MILWASAPGKFRVRAWVDVGAAASPASRGVDESWAW